MIFSRQLLMSERQLITATAPSTDIIDLGATGNLPGGSGGLPRDLSAGTAVPIIAQVVEAFNNLTNLVIALQNSDAENFGSGVRTLASETVLLADLVPGRNYFLRFLPRRTTLRYLRLNYTVTGTAPTTGRITAGITMSDAQTNL